MRQEKMAKLLMLFVLFYVAIPVLSFDGPFLQQLFSVAWMGFAGMLLVNLLFKKDKAEKRSVKKQIVTPDSKMKKRIHMES
ncbi:hypothetical protein ABE65_015575 [Fictibacillus phosphorivorans]|uniref:Uncharacterized protein n=1 Tax=Fictibacillus phosphorivorans TaxID=1221500 RepID=A0A160IQ04_9BACL|nr:hypothetical protein [Fictibacillus phosphorivorans]ANC78140.1 hypothetical protein ABE65_015575 [Fictibacillus phosphorivorans]